jgi:REP element-mobilizing transposase RayT
MSKRPQFIPYDPRLVDSGSSYRRNLPHLRQEGGTYFITYRLADSMPTAVHERWERARRQWLFQFLPSDLAQQYWTSDPKDIPLAPLVENLPGEFCSQYSHEHLEPFQKYLDAGHSECHLRSPQAAKIIGDAFHHFDGERYWLDSFVVMPNHVHAILTPYGGWELETITHSLKSYTANKINKLVGRRGTLWQDEPYDHIVRSESQLHFYCHYIAQNPRHLQPGEYLWYEVQR